MSSTVAHTSDLVREALDGDRQALDRLLRESLPVVYGFVGQSLTGSDVDDVVQETMLRAVTSLSQLRDPARFRSWLLAIAVAETRRRGRARQTLFARLSPVDTEQLPGRSTAPDDVVISELALSQQRRETAAAGAWLDPDDQELLHLWWLEVAGTLKRSELARTLGIPTVHAAVRVQRLKSRLSIVRGIVRALENSRRRPCAALEALRADWDGRPNSVWRKRFARHTGGCVICGELQTNLVSPERLLAAVPLLLPPPELVVATTAAVKAGSVSAAAPGFLIGLRELVAAALAKPVSMISALAVGAGSAGAAFVTPIGPPPRPPAAIAPATTAPEQSATARRPDTTAAAAPAPSTAAGPSRATPPPPTVRTTRVSAPPVVRGALPALPDTDYPVPPGAVFVAPGGRDTDAGSPTAPLASLGAAIARAPRGGTIVLAAGTYRTGAVKIDKKLTVQPAAHAQVWLLGSVVVSGWRRAADRWCVAWNHRLPIPAAETPAVVDAKHPLSRQREAVYVDGGELSQVRTPGQVGPGQFAVDRAAKRLCVGTDPRKRQVEAVARQQGIAVRGASAAGTVIRGLGFAHYAEQAVSVAAPRTRLDTVTATRNAVHGIRLDGAAGGSAVLGSVLSYNGRKGLGADGVDRLVVANNAVAFNNTAGFKRAGGAGGLGLSAVPGAVVRDNLLVANFGVGAQVAEDSTGAVLDGNYANANAGAGLSVQTSAGARLVDNVAVDNQAGLAVGNAPRPRVVHNTVVDNTTNIVVRHDGARRPPAPRQPAQWATTGAEIVGNLLVDTSSPITRTQVQAEVVNQDCATRPALVRRLDGNGYRDDDPGAGPMATLPPAGDSCTPRRAQSVADLRRLGFEQRGTAFDSRPAQSYFVAGDVGDFRLRDTSPPHDRATPAPADLAALLGVAAGQPVPLGARGAAAGPTTPAATVPPPAPRSAAPTGAPGTPAQRNRPAEQPPVAKPAPSAVPGTSIRLTAGAEPPPRVQFGLLLVSGIAAAVAATGLGLRIRRGRRRTG